MYVHVCVGDSLIFLQCKTLWLTCTCTSLRFIFLCAWDLLLIKRKMVPWLRLWEREREGEAVLGWRSILGTYGKSDNLCILIWLCFNFKYKGNYTDYMNCMHMCMSIVMIMSLYQSDSESYGVWDKRILSHWPWSLGGTCGGYLICIYLCMHACKASMVLSLNT